MDYETYNPAIETETANRLAEIQRAQQAIEDARQQAEALARQQQGGRA
ncbi:hypothetical protein OG906_43500 (plasmid) [Streptomyces sp. NBC_01426]|nr:hypothetical protein [Streptomyces sp. NBC_01426]